MKAMLLVMVVMMVSVGCTTDEDAPEEIVKADDGEDDGHDAGVSLAGSADPGEDDGDGDSDGTVAADGDDGEDFPEPGELDGALEDPPTEVVDIPEEPQIPLETTPPPPVTTPYQWTPDNSGGTPLPVRQADLTIQCQQVGPGVNPGYVRFGCKAYKRDGTRYGIVKGWWQVVRGDGARAKAKDLNFREGGYDMAFEVLAPDAVVGIQVRPGPGEARPNCPTCY